ncbi:sulfotransferase domain-containing protein [Leptolyngbya sp. AN02str]|uniref:sulfotransferase domain-containing protein n=1 Tax=Leptolyngbya sp. AN02str TaxID=3423363 RepID=UPI003D316849
MLAAEFKPVLIYTTHKAASMFVHQLTSEIAQARHLHYHSINDKDVSIYQHIVGTSWNEFIRQKLQLNQPCCFGPIRSGEGSPSIPEDLDRFSVILHLRDPRDVLVSLFFSHTFSHKIDPNIFNPGDEQRKQWEQEGVDRFSLRRANHYKDNYHYVIANLLGRKNVTLVKYEDMVLNYHLWLEQFLAAFLGGSSEKSMMQKLLNRLPFSERFKPQSAIANSPLYQQLYANHKDEFVVAKEDIYRHRRQIAPGDHRRKLQPETIAALNETFADILSVLGYSQ